MIIIEPHTLERAIERGTDENEIIDVILNGVDGSANKGRLLKYKIFAFDNSRNDKYYKQKKVEVIFTKEEKNIYTVTVYVYYGKWEEM
jgi:hypothetical protein